MIGLLITGHGHFASGLRSSMELVTGVAENAAFVDFEVDDTPETLEGKFNRALEKLQDCDGVLALCDLAGGTPYKVAVEMSLLSAEKPMKVIGGISLPMVLEGAMSAGEHTSPAELAEELLECGAESMTLFQMAQPTVSNEEEPEDGI